MERSLVEEKDTLAAGDRPGRPFVSAKGSTMEAVAASVEGTAAAIAEGAEAAVSSLQAVGWGPD